MLLQTNFLQANEAIATKYGKPLSKCHIGLFSNTRLIRKNKKL
jgi:hypothetical protein